MCPNSKTEEFTIETQGWKGYNEPKMDQLEQMKKVLVKTYFIRINTDTMTYQHEHLSNGIQKKVKDI